MNLVSSETSVVIPCYRQARFLGQAIGSALAQTRTAGEILVVDDGSPDDTAEVARSFGPPVVLLRHPRNLGISAARNTAIAHARGRNLALLDADDLWDPTFLERSLALLERRPSSAGTYCRYRLVDVAGTALGERGERVPERRFRRWIEGWGTFAPSTLVLRADAVAAVGGFDPALGSLEDRDYLLRLARTHVLSGVGDRLVSVRRHGANMTAAVERHHANRRFLLAKHYGAPEGDPAAWPREKRRAYGLGHASAAMQHVAAGREDEAWELLCQALDYWPGAVASDRTLWEMLCGDLQEAQRHAPPAELLDRRGPELRRRLEQCTAFARPGARAVVLGRARLNLGWMYYGAGRPAAAASELRSALACHPRLALDRRAIGLGFRLAAGTRARRLAHRLRGRADPAAAVTPPTRSDSGSA